MDNQTLEHQLKTYSNRELTILHLACDVGLFRAVCAKNNSVNTISHFLNINEHKIDVLLSALASMHIIEISEDSYKLLIDVNGKDEWMGQNQVSSNGIYQELITGILRDDRDSHKPFFDNLSDIETRIFHAGLYPVSYSFASSLVEKMDFSGYTHLLDVGCSNGAYSIAILQKYPSIRASLFDLPIACEVAEELLEQNNLSDRATIIEGDFLEQNLPVGADLILVSRIIHDWPDNIALDLLMKCHYVLEQTNGTLVIHEEMLWETKDGPKEVAISSVALVANVPGARARSQREIIALAQEAGFMFVKSIQVNDTFTALKFLCS